MPAGDTRDRYGNLIRNMRAAVAIYVEEDRLVIHAASLLNEALAELESQQTRLARQGELLNLSGQREARLLKRVAALQARNETLMAAAKQWDDLLS